MSKSLKILCLAALMILLLLPTCTQASVTGNTLNGGDQLLRGESMKSTNGQYTFIMQDDGNLVLYGRGRALWATGTDGRAVKNCIMQTDGNLVLYDYNNKAVWASGTFGDNRLIVQDDGNVVIYKYGAVWASNTNQSGTPDSSAATRYCLTTNQQLLRGEELISRNGLFRIILQDDGNLVLYGLGKALWASGTDGKVARNCIMQSDGNLVIYNYADQAIWASNTDGHPNPIFIMQNDGNAVIYADTAIWDTGTWK